MLLWCASVLDMLLSKLVWFLHVYIFTTHRKCMWISLKLGVDLCLKARLSGRLASKS